MHTLFSSSFCTKFVVRFIRRQPRIGYLAFDALMIILMLAIYKFIYTNKTFHTVCEKVLEGLESSRFNSLSYLQSFQIFLIYRLSLTLTILHTYVLSTLWLRKRFLGGELDESNFIISTFEIIATFLIFICTFCLPYELVNIYSQISLFGSVLFLAIQIISFTSFLFKRAQKEEKKGLKRCSSFFFGICILICLCLTGVLSFHIWEELKTCQNPQQTSKHIM